MSDTSNPNIIRASFEEIQEFKNLNLYAITGTPEGTIILLSYDPATKVFSSFEFDTTSNVVSIVNQSALDFEITVNTDKLPLEQGYKFRKDASLTEVIQLLASPKFSPIVELEGKNEVTTESATDTLLVEINTPTDISATYVYDARDGGSMELASEVYRIGGAVVTLPHSLTLSTESSTPFSITTTSQANSNFDVSYPTAEVSIKGVYPIIHGTSDTGALPTSLEIGIDGAGGSILTDQEEVVLPFTPSTSIEYYWFAVKVASPIPINWIGVYSNGSLQYSNEGLVSGSFDNKGGVVYKGNLYNVYMTKAKTSFEQNIKVNF